MKQSAVDRALVVSHADHSRPQRPWQSPGIHPGSHRGNNLGGTQPATQAASQLASDLHTRRPIHSDLAASPRTTIVADRAARKHRSLAPRLKQPAARRFRSAPRPYPWRWPVALSRRSWPSSCARRAPASVATGRCRTSRPRPAPAWSCSGTGAPRPSRCRAQLSVGPLISRFQAQHVQRRPSGALRPLAKPARLHPGAGEQRPRIKKWTHWPNRAVGPDRAKHAAMQCRCLLPSQP